MTNKFEQIIKLKMSQFEKKMENPCQPGYVAYGTKMKDGREVPNCVPEKMESVEVNFESYPWDKCIEDQVKAYGDEETAKKVCGAIKAGMRKQDFVIPSPEGGEDENTFISRCIKAIYDEYGQEQSAAICYSKWRDK